MSKNNSFDEVRYDFVKNEFVFRDTTEEKHERRRLMRDLRRDMEEVHEKELKAQRRAYNNAPVSILAQCPLCLHSTPVTVTKVKGTDFRCPKCQVTLRGDFDSTVQIIGPKMEPFTDAEEPCVNGAHPCRLCASYSPGFRRKAIYVFVFIFLMLALYVYGLTLGFGSWWKYVMLLITGVMGFVWYGFADMNLDRVLSSRCKVKEITSTEVVKKWGRSPERINPNDCCKFWKSKK